jgi:hypothetical protein
MENAVSELAAIKMTLVCIAVSMWGITVYLFLKEFIKK